MAKQVFTTEEILLQDGTKIVLQPSRIARLRRLMKVWGSLDSKRVETKDEEGNDVELTDEERQAQEDLFLNTCMECAGIALVPEVKRLSTGPKAPFTFEDEIEDENYELSDEYVAWLEETLDLDSMYKVLEVCAKLRLNDPKLLAALEAQVQAGTSLT